MFELEDGGKDLVVKILDPTLQSSQLLEFKVRDLKEGERRCWWALFFRFYSL